LTASAFLVGSTVVETTLVGEAIGFSSTLAGAASGFFKFLASASSSPSDSEADSSSLLSPEL